MFSLANASAITYDFTGVTTSGSVGVGTLVTGSFTIDYDNANPSLSSGTIGSTSSTWTEETTATTLPQYVYTLSLQAGSWSYASTPNSSSTSYASGVLSPNTDSFIANETATSGLHFDSGSQVSFEQTSASAGAPWTSAGLPIFDSSNSNVGEASYGTSYVDFKITSLTTAPVPVPAAAWLMLSGLCGLVFFAQKRLT